MNAQDVLRDVHDASQHALKTTASLGASTVYIGTPTLFAVVNTAAAGVGNSIVTVINPITLNSVVTLSPSVNAIGFATVFQASSARTITGNVTTYPSQYSFYQQSSLVSGYVFYGNALPGSNPTTASFKIQRETLFDGSVLFASGAATFTHTWSSASLASLSYL